MKRKTILIILAILLMCCITTTATTTAVILFIRSRELDARLNQETVKVDDTNTLKDDSTNNPDEDIVVSSEYELKTKTMSEDTEAYTIDIKYPELINYSNSSTQADFNDLVFYKVNSMAREIRFTEPSMMSAKNFIELEYTVEYQSSRFISILVKGQNYFGGAHPNPVIISINYDLETNKELALKDLFLTGANYLTPISNASIYELQSTLGEAFEESGVTPDVDNFKNFNFNQTTLKITFDAYQVGPSAVGTPQVEMTLVDFTSILKPEFK